MELSVLWSLRLGFSSAEAKKIESAGLKRFLEDSFSSSFDNSLPDFLQDQPKSIKEWKEFRKKIKESDPETRKRELLREINKINEVKLWWLEKMVAADYPLREKMVGFWQNHFVVSSAKVPVNYWLFQYNSLLRENAFGNFRELTKKVVKSNAMVHYLDNTDNRRGKLNENLSRELLELFTLGIGNYSEDDIKNGAKGLAGLTPGDETAVYRPLLADNEPFTYLGKTAAFKSDAMIDQIFEQPQIPYLLTRKILKWFIYDNPDEKLVTYYGDYFRKSDFEIKPLLVKICTEEFQKPNVAMRIKDPLTYILQLYNELEVAKPNLALTGLFLKKQGMDLLNPPSVKGWDGGRSWLTGQILLQRYQVADLLCLGKNIKGKAIIPNENGGFSRKLTWEKGDNKKVISELSGRLLCQTDADSEADFEKLLPYDFNPDDESADSAVLRLFNAMIKTPEFQII
ncbi:DUF1800 domain-containing protein [Flavobacterium silvaticum]|uniref:DUF1800 domain-containing protein n=1 Tax=Flavobacterium silvaticum TaxID=1852020 RepID=A0A972FU97_9FLAO|nr:DUF1800 domain-containing protein [Flavobacterium silvaticum]NMH29434.1 DUF1800 domain-containing protein [Flavobacterium silvaticum]